MKSAWRASRSCSEAIARVAMARGAAGRRFHGGARRSARRSWVGVVELEFGARWWMGGGAGDCGRFKGGRPEISAWEQGRESRRSRRDSGAGVALRGRRSWQAGPGCSERRGALARWRVGLGATRGEGRRGERAGLRRQVGPAWQRHRATVSAGTGRAGGKRPRAELGRCEAGETGRRKRREGGSGPRV